MLFRSLDIHPFWDGGGAWCSRTRGARISIFVNDINVLEQQLQINDVIPEVETTADGISGAGRPHLSVDVTLDAGALRSIK